MPTRWRKVAQRPYVLRTVRPGTAARPFKPQPGAGRADLLADLVHSGRAVRASGGRYRAGALSRSTEWRVLNWRLLAERWRAAQADPPRYLL